MYVKIWKMSESEIWKDVYNRNKHHNCLSDIFEEEELTALLDHPDYEEFSDDLKASIWQAVS